MFFQGITVWPAALAVNCKRRRLDLQGDACCAIVNISQDEVGKKKVNELGRIVKNCSLLRNYSWYKL